MHSEHRKRVKNKIFSYGGDALCKHEKLEALLFYSIPRVNTNEQAHRLIDGFGSLGGVFEADIGALTRVEGIGENSAILIKLVHSIMDDISKENSKSIAKKNKGSVSSDYLISLFEGVSEERLYYIALDNSMKILEVKCIEKGKVNFSNAVIDEIVRTTVYCGAANVMLAHNHPHGIAIPSSSDIQATQSINNALRFIQVNLVEHFIVSADRCTTVMH